MSYPEFKEALEEYGRVAAVVAAAPDGDFSTRILAARWRVMQEVSRVLEGERPRDGAVWFLADATKDLIGRLDAAHAALSFYAEPMNYVSGSGYDPAPAPVKSDHGERARRTLRVIRNADPVAAPTGTADAASGPAPLQGCAACGGRFSPEEQLFYIGGPFDWAQRQSLGPLHDVCARQWELRHAPDAAR